MIFALLKKTCSLNETDFCWVEDDSVNKLFVLWNAERTLSSIILLVSKRSSKFILKAILF